ncbi:unnamed protein product [Clavelina lepadiformis]
MLSYYVVVGKIIRVNSIISGEHLSTLAGIDYQITLTKQHNKFFVNGQEIVQQDLRTQHGIFQGLSVALTPTKRYCDKTATKFIKSECLPCNMPFSCPGNSIPQARIHCLRSILHFTTSLLGCKLICKQQTRIPNCCANFYGPQCQPCPGGIGQFCSNNGVCSDGIKGNGTCTCSDQKFSGLACDNCRSGLYGTDCDYSCGCINGTCDDGKMGKGICICNHGFRGPLCDQLVDSNDGCQGKCDFAAFCVETSTNEGRCRCGTGYSGSGTKCSPINPCEDSSNVLCHRFASCQYAGPGIHICKCKTGYRGDGVYCEEINPCIQENFSSCDLTADCFHTGPNQFNCICKSGYTGDGKTCQAVNPCKTGNGGCHVYAKCHYKGPGVNTCHCLANYIGDGIQNCTGSIFVELQSDTRFASFIRRRMMKNALNSPGPITAFLPDLTLMGNPVIDQIIEQGLLGHIVGCNQYTVEQLHNISQLHSLSGKLINITSSEDSIFLNGNIRVATPIRSLRLKFPHSLLVMISDATSFEDLTFLSMRCNTNGLFALTHLLVTRYIINFIAKQKGQAGKHLLRRFSLEIDQGKTTMKLVCSMRKKTFRLQIRPFPGCSESFNINVSAETLTTLGTAEKYVLRLLEQHEWIKYDQQKDVAIFSECNWASSANHVTPDVISTFKHKYPVWLTGYKDWKYIKGAAKKHSESSLYKRCLDAKLNYAGKSHVATLVNSKAQENPKRNRIALEAIFESIRFLAQQGLA